MLRGSILGPQGGQLFISPNLMGLLFWPILMKGWSVKGALRLHRTTPNEGMSVWVGDVLKKRTRSFVPAHEPG